MFRLRIANEQIVHGGLMRGASGLVDGSTLAAQMVGIVQTIPNKLTAGLETTLYNVHDNAEEEMLDER